MKSNFISRLLPSLIILSILLGCSFNFVMADEESPWPSITREQKPWTYWWQMGSAVDKQNITLQLEQYQKAGLGGVHIIPIYGAKGWEDKYIDFLSPKWMDMLAYTVSEADRLGMGVDMTLGTGWCFGGPTVTDEEANAKLQHVVRNVTGGQTLDGLSNPAVQAIVAYGSDGRKIDLSRFIKPDGSFGWTAPEGTWQAYEIWQKPSGRKVKRAAPGGQGCMINPFYAKAMEDYLKWFDRAFENYTGSKPRSVYHDSYEYVCDWSPDLLAEFETRRGYRLQDYLPSLLSDDNNETVRRVKADYRRTISEMMMDNFAAPWVNWSHANGFLTRNEAHGAPCNLLDFYAAADMPETEFFRLDRNPLIAKFASSAGHTAGRQRISSETATWLKDHFHVTLADLKCFIDGLFVSGVNHIFYHGTCYSPAEAPWPGWVFYASTQMNPRNSIWHDVDALNGYLARCQSVLQAGSPDQDILLYWPIHDYWHSRKGLVQNMTVHKTRWFEGQPIGPTAKGLWDAGYAFDYISDARLAAAKADKDGTIQLPGGTYRTIVVPFCTYMPLETLNHLHRLAAEGARVVFEKSLPDDVPGLSNLEVRQAELQEILNSLQWELKENIGWSAPIDNGAFWRTDDMQAVMTQIGIQRETMVDHESIEYIRRKDNAGNWYFIINADHQFTSTPDIQPVNEWITLSRPAKTVLVMDPMTGQIGTAPIRMSVNSQTEVYLAIEPGQSLILRTFDDKQPLSQWKYYEAAGEPAPITGQWNIEFVQGGPEIPTSYTTDKLTSWTDRDDPDAKRFAGTAKYTILFDRPVEPADAWKLDLGRIAQSARVTLNGKDGGTVFCLPHYVILPVEAVNPLNNKLEIEVTNLAANRIRDLDTRGVRWTYFHDINLVDINYKKMDASKWPLEESGLLGPVKLIPLEAIQPK